MNTTKLMCFAWLLTSPLVFAQKTLYGTVSDAVSNQPLSVVINIRSSKGANARFETQADGKFEMVLPQNADSLSIEKTGYRRYGIFLGTSTEIPERLRLDIRLIPNDKQRNNGVYQQSEQKHVVVAKTKNENQQQICTFRALDALTNTPISANFTLISTATGQKNTYNTANSFEVAFSQKDIIAVEVYAKGYQPYKGNLIVESLGGEKKQNLIRMVRDESVLNLQIRGINDKDSELLRCELINSENKTQSLKRIDKNLFGSTIKEKQTYQINVFIQKQLVHQSSISTQRGLNVRVITVEGFQNAPLEEPLEVKTFPQRIVIYFDQSLPDLREDAKVVLDQIAVTLSLNKQLKAFIVGHTDNVGKPDLNMALSEYRARGTRGYLAEKGIEESRMTWEGKGHNDPVAPNDIETNKLKNRRVEILLRY